MRLRYFPDRNGRLANQRPDLEDVAMRIEEISRELSAKTRDLIGTNAIAVSEGAKRQIAAKVLESKAYLSGARLGPSFLDGFDDGPIT
jgi:hypothetical protein